MTPEAKVVSREPWWASPPKPGQTDEDLVWGYLERLSSGDFRFNPERPSDDEIRNRKGCRLYDQ